MFGKANLRINYVWQKLAYEYIKWSKKISSNVIVNINKSIIEKNYKKTSPTKVSIN